MNTKFLIGSAILSILQASTATGSVSVKKYPKPNILILLADDLGYGDVQCYNPQRGKILTPNIDRLSSQGMRFTDGHSSSAVCSPSRYTLLTGRYHWRTRLQSGIVNVFGEPLIAPDRLTIASLVKPLGYKTACIGKWHLGWDWPIDIAQRKLFQFAPFKGQDEETIAATPAQLDGWQQIFSKPITGGPTTRGFDSYFGTDVPNWPPFCFIENDRTLGIPSELLPPKDLRKNLASLPGPALKDWKLERILPTLVDRAIIFIEESSKDPNPFLLYLPLTAPHTPLAVNDPWRGKSGLIPYADFVMETDAMVGRILDALEKSGAAGNTLVIFTSDNGCAPYIGIETLEEMGHFPSGPLRGYKGDAWEGGHRVPFIVRWPGVVKPGCISDQLVHQADFMATFADILGLKLPDTAGEDSYSILPLLKGKDKPTRIHAVSCALTGTPSVRDGKWKLLLGSGSSNMSKARDDKTIKLFDLAADPGERINLATQHPLQVTKMKEYLEEIIEKGRSTSGESQKNDTNILRYPMANK
jgi:arylsulfatase A